MYFTLIALDLLCWEFRAAHGWIREVIVYEVVWEVLPGGCFRNESTAAMW